MSAKSAQSIRVIGGKWRSRIIGFPAIDGLRPTGSRIRETLFNWLAPYIEGARCLDLFAGSGALSFEALSRGAESCLALENSTDIVKQLRANQVSLEANNLSLLKTDTRDYLRTGNNQRPFDIVFLDPPFADQLHTQISHLLADNGWLRNEAFIYTESPASEHLSPPANWQPLRKKTAGEVTYCLYQHVELSAQLQ